jgi:DNA-binding NarL/FixJ family response regulator
MGQHDRAQLGLRFSNVAPETLGLRLAQGAAMKTGGIFTPGLVAATLTDRQRLIIAALLCGATRKELANSLSLSPQTIASHLRRARRRTASGSAAALVDTVLKGSPSLTSSHLSTTPLSLLTPAELAGATFIGAGLGNRAIAAQRKTGVSTRLQLVALVRSHRAQPARDQNDDVRPRHLAIRPAAPHS